MNVCRCGAQIPGEWNTICAKCRRDPVLKGMATYWLVKKREQERVDREAARATRRLPRKDAFTPIAGERIVELMQRGEW